MIIFIYFDFFYIYAILDQLRRIMRWLNPKGVRENALLVKKTIK